MIILCTLIFYCLSSILLQVKISIVYVIHEDKKKFSLVQRALSQAKGHKQERILSSDSIRIQQQRLGRVFNFKRSPTFYKCLYKRQNQYRVSSLQNEKLYLRRYMKVYTSSSMFFVDLDSCLLKPLGNITAQKPGKRQFPHK